MKRSFAKTVKVGDHLRTKARSPVRAEGTVVEVITGDEHFKPLFVLDGPNPGPFTYGIMVQVSKANRN